MDWAPLLDELASLIITLIIIFFWRRSIRHYRQLVRDCRRDLRELINIYEERISGLKDFQQKSREIIEAMTKLSWDINAIITRDGD